VPALDTSILRSSITYDIPPSGPSQEINAVVTYAARKKWCEVEAGVGGATHPKIAYFKIGEGGWVLDGSVRVTRSPDPAFRDLDCVLDASRTADHQRYPVAERYYFQKSLGVGELTLESVFVVLAQCALTTAEGNAGIGKFWEIGLFDDDGDMVVYGTFTEGEDKNSGKTLQRDVRVYRG
jgi:hypothetical protein